MRAVGYSEVVARLRQRLPPRARIVLELPGARLAAVAILLVDRGGDAHVPLILRGADAPVHSGQIALPGGRREPGDPTLIATAARETYEELGIDPARLDVLGELDDCPTPTGFVITPVVAALGPEPVAYRPNPLEVADLFEAPLAVFGDRDAAEYLGERSWRGVTYHMRAYHVGAHRVWGATARILEGLVDVIG